jgi:TonB family protein
LTVTTGPIGGGGLRVYGVLRGGKVYTIYLSMPGRNWVLQYVHNTGSSERPTQESRAAVAHLEKALMPPDAEKQFDFHRPPVPRDKEDEFIVLRGMIREDGSVTDLRVHQGIQPLADQAAVAAFSKWKFRPALRDGKPVAVEILVGVPAHVVASGESSARSPGD